ncbi:hypothetical protein [Polyangium mundeleinium]|uniref:DUF3800 domain-containing protein n=1 Tax=Polyangium mundeleinium TaxID=2995306 RepID=A0ABT5ERK0_9BACT|nr:hypothetical protein [Polyangium mundeleinium]MDC0744458.1 hypothetical protein [Polyangium mundeleinium]
MTVLVTFCEASADFRAIEILVDRVLHEEGPDWLADNFDTKKEREAFRTFKGESDDRPFYDVHDVSRHFAKLEKDTGSKVLVPHASFDGRRLPKAMQVYTILHFVRALSKIERVDGVLIVVDMDKHGKEGRAGMDKARAAPFVSKPFRVALGCPNPCREAWIVAGFIPASSNEREALKNLKLGFSLPDEPHRIHEAGDPHKVIKKLTNDVRAREDRCLEEPPLDTLATRGKDAGLADFLNELRREILPLYARPA